MGATETLDLAGPTAPLESPRPPQPPATKRSRRRRLYFVAAYGLLAAGLAMSAGCALIWGSAQDKNDRHAFDATAANITATLGTLLRRDADFVSTLRAVMTLEPHLSATRFNTWYTALRSGPSEMGSLGTAIVGSVPARELASFLARRNGDPAFTQYLGRTPAPITPDGRARYCLVSAGTSLVRFSVAAAAALQGDWCSPSSTLGARQAALNRAATDSGQFLVIPVATDGLHTMLFEAAYYRRGGSRLTVAERRAAFAGWVLSSFDLSSAIRLAVGSQHGIAIALYHANPGQGPELLARVGDAGSAATFVRSSAMPIDGAWTVRISGGPVDSGLFAGTESTLVFAAGASISLLLFLLVLVLARSRDQALRLVTEKTGQLRHQALHDALTGLPNRVLALDRAEQLLARARRARVPAAALYIDLDGFKHVNDTLGHAAGDELLRIVAVRLQSVLREADTAARLAGDEFVALLEGSSIDAGPQLVAERMLEVLREPYQLSRKVGRQVSLSASIGVAHGLNGTAEELLADADAALYVAKAAGRDRYVVFESGMQTAAHDRMTLEMDLAEALPDDQLFLLYQPTFDLTSNRVFGVEALLRWNHPTRGVVAPDVFIPLAEEGGLIVPIGRWVLHEACRQGAIWHAKGHTLDISVNVSGRQLDGDGLIDDVLGALSESGLPPSALTLEITETALMRDAEASAWRLRELKKLGVRVAIDDFGTGYSSLAYLRQFPVDALKIDRSFISGIAESEESAALIHTLVGLGKALKLETLAEGIEDHAQLEALQRQHCDHGQGFLFARPLDVGAVEQFLDGAGVERVPRASVPLSVVAAGRQ